MALQALDNVLGNHSIGCTGSEWLAAIWDLPESKVYVFWKDKTELHLTVDKGKQECKRTFAWTAVDEILEFVNHPTGWQDKPIVKIDPSQFGTIRTVDQK